MKTSTALPRGAGLVPVRPALTATDRQFIIQAMQSGLEAFDGPSKADAAMRQQFRSIIRKLEG